jgi:hypothetical protein
MSKYEEKFCVCISMEQRFLWSLRLPIFREIQISLLHKDLPPDHIKHYQHIIQPPNITSIYAKRILIISYILLCFSVCVQRGICTVVTRVFLVQRDVT